MHHFNATTDNVDIQQSYAFVSSLDGSRSWHGTSTQLIQPLTLSGSLSQEDLHTQRAVTHIPRTCTQATSPINSPLPVCKHKRLRRTLTEQHSPHTSMSLPTESSREGTLLETVERAEYMPSHKRITKKDFKPMKIEQASLDILQEDLFKCVCLRKFAADNTLPGLVSMLSYRRVGLSSALRYLAHIFY